MKLLYGKHGCLTKSNYLQQSMLLLASGLVTGSAFDL